MEHHERADARSTAPSPSDTTDPGPTPACRLCHNAPARTLDVLGRRIVVGPCAACTAAQEQAEIDRQHRTIVASHRENIRALLARVGIDTRVYGDAELDRFDPDPDRDALDLMRRTVQRFIAGERPNLWITSERPNEAIAPGNGKTYLTVAGVRAILENSATHHSAILFTGFVDIFDDLLEAQADGGIRQRLRRYTAPELLVIDDFGLGGWTPFRIERMTQILSARAGRSTWATSNHRPSAIAEHAPEEIARVLSRIRGRGELAICRGPDRRR